MTQNNNDNDLEDRLDKPEIFPSDELSKKFNLEVSVLDFWHKRYKARDAIGYLERKGYDIGVAFTSGNYGRTLDLEAIGTNVQPISFVNKGKPITLIDIGNGKYGVRFRLPDRWFTPEQFEKYWIMIAENSFWTRTFSRNIRDITNYPEYEKFMNSIKRRGLDYRKVKAVTNLCEWPNNDPYDIPEIYDALKNNDVVLVPNGSSELLLAFLKARRRIWGKAARIVACTSKANIFADSYVFDGKIEKESEADKVDLLRPVKANWEARNLANKKTYFATIPGTYICAGAGLYNSKEQGDSRTNASLTSGIGIGAIMYALDNEMELPRTYRFEYLNPWVYKEGMNIWKKYPVRRRFSFKNGQRVCVVNTGGR